MPQFGGLSAVTATQRSDADSNSVITVCIILRASAGPRASAGGPDEENHVGSTPALLVAAPSGQGYAAQTRPGPALMSAPDGRAPRLAVWVRTAQWALDEFAFGLPRDEPGPRDCHRIADGLVQLAAAIRCYADEPRAGLPSSDGPAVPAADRPERQQRTEPAPTVEP